MKPKHSPAAIPAAQRDFLARWLRQWEVQEALDREPPAVAEGGSRYAVAAPVAVLPVQPEPAPGQVRLLAPALTPAASRPVYVAVLREWEPGDLLVAPFGPFSVPATTTELLTRRPDLALRVLCLWNARTVPMSVLRQSWLVDPFSDREAADAWTVFRCAATGRPVPATLARRVGPPIFVPHDPRLIYQTREAALLAALDGTGAAADGQTPIAADAWPLLAEIPMPLAAGTDRPACRLVTGRATDYRPVGWARLIVRPERIGATQRCRVRWRLEPQADAGLEADQPFRILDPDTRRTIGSGRLVRERGALLATPPDAQWADYRDLAGAGTPPDAQWADYRDLPGAKVRLLVLVEAHS